MIKKCIMCESEFKPFHKTDKYCCYSCSNRARGIRTGKYGKNGIMTKTCIVCGKEFSTTISHKKTCSDECSRKRGNARHRNLSPEQKARRKEYDRQKYLQKHPDALTQEERSELARVKRELEAPDRERRKQEYERQKEEWAKKRAEKEKRKQENIAHWLEYESEHTCVICGQDYIAHHPFSKYCSPTCSRKAIKKKKRYKGITVDSDISIFKLAERDRNQCQICGLMVDWNDRVKTDKTIICGNMYPSIDHIRPISKGGLHSWDNVQLAHRICNTRKNNEYTG